MAERGRPRKFCRDEALRRAMELFWRQGYEGTSLSDLTAAMGINAPSLYAAFGCKEALYREALELYQQVEGSCTEKALKEPTAREAITALLRNNLEAYTNPAKPRGCMVVLAAPNCTDETTELRESLAATRKSVETLLRKRLKQGIAEGELPAGTDVSAMAAFYNTVLQGMSIQARDGASRRSLQAIADCALASWDSLVDKK